MHMADALISPAVGATMWAVSGGLLGYCAKRTGRDLKERAVPLMGVLGAFVFAAQMINFSIPGTGASGHLGGGLLLAILLGPCPAFIVIASVLTVQALFFADGGLLALGCNLFNLGFWPAFIAYPLIYRPWAGIARGTKRAWAAAFAAAVVGLQLGAFSVVLETKASGVSALPFGTFLLLMAPMHLAIGVVEGLVTAAAISFVAQVRPEVFAAGKAEEQSSWGVGAVCVWFLAAALGVGAVLSWFAATQPDGLEWSIDKVTGSEELPDSGGALHRHLAQMQEETALLPDYAFRSSASEVEPAAEDATPPAWPAVSMGTSVSGMVGGIMTLCAASLCGWLLRRRSRGGLGAMD